MSKVQKEQVEDYQNFFAAIQQPGSKSQILPTNSNETNFEEFSGRKNVAILDQKTENGIEFDSDQKQ